MFRFKLAAFLICLGLVACGDDQDDAGARALLASVKDERYRTWERAPGYEQRRSSNAAHGGAVDIYVSDVVADVLALGEPATTWPEGATIVKDGFDGAELVLTAIMQKRTDGWYWAEYGADGNPSFSGHPSICIDCHRSGSDFVRAFRLP